MSDGWDLAAQRLGEVLRLEKERDQARAELAEARYEARTIRELKDDQSVTACRISKIMLEAIKDRDQALARLALAEAVVEAARKHVEYAKEKQDCGPCLDFCPNATNGDWNCECGASMMTHALAEFDKAKEETE